MVASLLPAQFELGQSALIHLGDHTPALLVAVVSLGKTLGSVINWALGYGTFRYADERWFPVNPDACRSLECMACLLDPGDALAQRSPFLEDCYRTARCWLTRQGEMPRKGEWNQIALQIAVGPEAFFRDVGKGADAMRHLVTDPNA